MKKLFITVGCMVVLLASGCESKEVMPTSPLSTGNEQSYYETCLNDMYLIGSTISEINKDYFNNVPASVTAEDEIELDSSYYDVVIGYVEDAKADIFAQDIIINPEIDENVNAAVVDSIQDSATIYFDMLDTYLEYYKKVFDYYNDDTYQANIESASQFDAEFLDFFYDWADSEMLLSRTVRGFLEVENINDETSTDIYKRTGFAMIVLSESADNIMDYLYTFDFSDSSITELQSLLDDIEKKHSEEQSEVDSIDFGSDDNASKLLTSFDSVYILKLTNFEVSVQQLITDLDIESDLSNDYDMIRLNYYSLIQINGALIALFNIY